MHYFKRAKVFPLAVEKAVENGSADSPQLIEQGNTGLGQVRVLQNRCTVLLRGL